MKKRSPPRLYGFALGNNESREPGVLHAAVESVLTHENAPNAIRFGGHVLSYASGAQWFVSHPDERDHNGVPSRVARALGKPLALVRVELDVRRLHRLKGDDFENELPIETCGARWFQLGADGGVRPDSTDRDDEPAHPAGDEYETLQAYLWDQFDRDDETDRKTLDGYIIPENPNLSPRLSELRDLIVRVGRYELVEVAGRRMIRVDSGGGERRMAAVTDEELAELQTTLGFSPG
jgi:hypothetical protein